MGAKRSIHSTRENSERNLAVPPGFVPLTSITLKKQMIAEAAHITAGGDFITGSISGSISSLDIEKFKASFNKRPWMAHNQLDCSRTNLEKTEAQMGLLRSTCLPKGVIRGCANCDDCVKVTARYHPENSSLPELEDAPVFYPTEQEFREPLKYIAKIYPKAENFGICRIVPPPSRKPPCLLRDGKRWEESKFGTHVQRIDGLQNFYLKKKLSRLHTNIETKNPKVSSSMRVKSSSEIVLDAKEDQHESSDFESGLDLTLQSFKKYADDFKKQFFSPLEEPLIARIEGEYWRIIENPTEEIEVLCCQDLSRKLGSGFPIRDSPIEYSEYMESGWNLNNISKVSGSLLPFGCYDSSTILVPQLFIGMCFASQCWKTEDHQLCSLSYMHLGDSKMCYGIPGRYYFKFMEVVKKLCPQIAKHPQLLHGLVTQISPSVLTSEGIPVYRCVQNPMEFVLIFPGAYHTEFSCGFNCSEAINFASFDWLPHGLATAELYSDYRWKTSISLDRLLIQASMEAVRAAWQSFIVKDVSIKNQLWIKVSGKDGILTKTLKARVKAEGIRREIIGNCATYMKLDEDLNKQRECSICLSDLYLSGVGCLCIANRYSCFRHAKKLCKCAWGSKRSFYRYDMDELDLLVEAMEGNLSAIRDWAKKTITSHFVLPEKNAAKNEDDSRVGGVLPCTSKPIVEMFQCKDVILIVSDDEDE